MTDPVCASWYERTIDADTFQCPTHMHVNSHEIMYVTEGLIDIRIMNKQYTAGKNTLIFISNIESHKVVPLRFPYARYGFHIEDTYLKTHIDDYKLSSIFTLRPASFVHCIDVSEFAETVTFYLDSINKEYYGNDFYCSAMIKNYLNQLFVTLFRKRPQCFPIQEKPVNEMVYKIRDYIEQHYQQDLTMRELSARFFISEAYLIHSFRDAIGYTPKKYHLLKRISEARNLLYNTNLSVKEIGQQTGFHDTNNFIRMFKQVTEMTPGQYRMNKTDSAAFYG